MDLRSAASKPRALWARMPKEGCRLKAECVGELGDKRSFPNLPCGAPRLVVDEKDVTQRLVDEVEAEVTFNLSYGTVVLNEGVEKHSRVEGIKQAGVDQVGGEISRRQVHLIVIPRYLSREVVVGTNGKTQAVGVLVPVKKTSRL